MGKTIIYSLALCILISCRQSGDTGIYPDGSFKALCSSVISTILEDSSLNRYINFNDDNYKNDPIIVKYHFDEELKDMSVFGRKIERYSIVSPVNNYIEVEGIYIFNDSAHIWIYIPKSNLYVSGSYKYIDKKWIGKADVTQY